MEPWKIKQMAKNDFDKRNHFLSIYNHFSYFFYGHMRKCKAGLCQFCILCAEYAWLEGGLSKNGSWYQGTDARYGQFLDGILAFITSRI